MVGDFELFIVDDDRLDRIKGAYLTPWLAWWPLRLAVRAAVIACDDPVFHQHSPAIFEAYCFWVTADGLRQQAA